MTPLLKRLVQCCPGGQLQPEQFTSTAILQFLKRYSIFYLLLLLTGCHSTYNKIENYYKSTPELHQELSDSLVNFSKRYKTNITLSKALDGRNLIAFSIKNPSTKITCPVIFDSLLVRTDPYPGQTMQFDISVKTIMLFRQLKYNQIRSDSSTTFFGGPLHMKFQLGTQNDLLYGILISNDMETCEGCYKSLAPHTWLTELTIP